jgi:hypothetical protein
MRDHPRGTWRSSSSPHLCVESNSGGAALTGLLDWLSGPRPWIDRDHALTVDLVGPPQRALAAEPASGRTLADRPTLARLVASRQRGQLALLIGRDHVVAGMPPLVRPASTNPERISGNAK